jgi:hypothetical protein
MRAVPLDFPSPFSSPVDCFNTEQAMWGTHCVYPGTTAVHAWALKAVGRERRRVEPRCSVGAAECTLPPRSAPRIAQRWRSLFLSWRCGL